MTVSIDSRSGMMERLNSGALQPSQRTKLAIIVSHPIQYYAPLYQRLARRSDLSVKVFFTWHSGERAVEDRGFQRPIAWDIPLTEGYEWELAPNTASDPGTHHFFGLRNPSLIARVQSWAPDAVHITGWAWDSHLQALRVFSKAGVPTLFRGDSHLLDKATKGLRWWLKSAVLRQVFRWPAMFLTVGAANRSYCETFGVDPDRMFPCPHSIDVRRFAEPHDAWEREAAECRGQLGIAPGQKVLLFAGKFERKKRPVELMRAVQTIPDSSVVLVMLGNGELESEVKAIAASDPARFRVLPFQNQSRMPVVYRLGDVFVLPSLYGETWGLAVNEAMACGRPVVISDRVGCAQDVVDESCGRVFKANDFHALASALIELTTDTLRLQHMKKAAGQRAWAFDIGVTENSVVEAVGRICPR